jgi:hypothetical protein
MLNSLVKYGIMASPHSFGISPETLSGPADLFLPIAVNLLMILVLMARGSHEVANCICEMLRSQLNTGE